VFYASSANGTNHTGKQPNTYSDISEVHPTSVLPLRQNLVTALLRVMQMQTGGVTWTLDALLPDYVFKVYGGTVAWKSRRQPTVALSTTEAEYMASADAARQAIWLRLLLDDLQLGLGNKPFPIMNDNAGTIALSKNPVHHERSKHIGLRHHFLRERVEDNTISLSHVPSADNIADLLTKGLPRELFDRLRDLLFVNI